MLGKLLKYDLKWIYKLIMVFYILALIFSAIGRGLIEVENSLLFNILGQICIGTAISMMVSSLINCLMRSWVRFSRNMYKDECYLTHTLPVEKKTIYLSKVLAAIIAIFTSTIVILGCLAICYYSQENIEMLKTVLELAADTYNTTVIELVLIIAVMLFVEIVFIVMIGYVGIILGHKFSSGKMSKSIGIGFLLYMVTQIISIVIMFIVGLFDDRVMNLINTTEMINVDTIRNIMYAGIIVYLIYVGIYYIIGKKQLEKGVNVD